jgi:hypothetical protein
VLVVVVALGLCVRFVIVEKADDDLADELGHIVHVDLQVECGQRLQRQLRWFVLVKRNSLNESPSLRSTSAFETVADSAFNSK